MLLSAFFTYGSLMRGKRHFGEFLTGRLWRIYPLYLIMVLVYIGGCLVFPSMSKLPANLGAAAVYLVETLLFLPGLLPIRPLMDVSWTLSFVILFYFIAAGLAQLFRWWGLARVRRFTLLTLAALLWAFTGNVTGWWEPRTAIFWTGMALSEVIGAVTLTQARFAAAMRLSVWAAVITMLGAGLRTWMMMGRPDTGMVPFLVLRFIITSVTLCAFVWVAYFGPEWWKRLLSGPQLTRLGAASYSFYLTHGFSLKAFRYGIFPWLGDAVRLEPVFWISQIAGLALAIAIARVVYAFVELPLASMRLPFRLPAKWLSSPAPDSEDSLSSVQSGAAKA
jgi:peptidoglycan/LPS O-acetylase OafA/YrhL